MPHPQQDSVDRDLTAWLEPMAEVDPDVEAARQRIGRLSRLFTRTLEEVAVQEDLSIADWEALSAIVRAGDACKPTALADALGLTSGTVAVRLARLHRAGLIAPASDGDGRSRPVRVSEQGFARWRRATAERTRAEAELFEALSPTQVATLNDLLRVLLRTLEAAGGLASIHDATR